MTEEKIKVALFAAEGAHASGLYGLVDAFFTANYIGRKKFGSQFNRQFEPLLVSMDGNPVRAFNGRQLAVDAAVADIESAQIVVLGASFGSMRKADDIAVLLRSMMPVVSWIRQLHASGAYVASCCTGSFLLAEAGLLDGKATTTHWRLAPILQRMYPKLKVKGSEILVENERILCAGGALSSVNLALKLIETFAGRETGLSCAKLLVADPSRDSQLPYRMFMAQVDHGDEAIVVAQKWLEEHYAETITIEEAAANAGLGDRNFKRRFKDATGETPLNYLQHVRIHHAKNKLEMTRKPSNQIIWDVGYEDLSSFRRLFKREVGMTMEEYRKRFGLSA